MSDPKPKRQIDGPYLKNLESGTYHWCGCGRSSNDPICDGSHIGTDYEGHPNAGLAFTVDVKKDLILCGCKATKHPPGCDSAHYFLHDKK